MRTWVRAVFRGGEMSRQIQDELAFHIESYAGELERRGLAREEALRRARAELGSVAARREDCRRAWGAQFFDELLGDLRYALRMLARSPGFTAVSALSLALAIGANTTIFSVAKQLLYERLNVPDAADLRLLTWTNKTENTVVHSTHGDWYRLPGGGATSPLFSYPVYQQLRAQNRVLGDLLGFRETGMNATINGHAQRALAEMVSGNYYAVLEVQPELGRAIEPADDAGAGQPVAVISDELWEREFGRSPSAVGQWIKLNDKPVMIVGVNARGFTGAKNVQEAPDVTVPLALEPLLTPTSGKRSWIADPGQWWVNVLARAKPGVSDAAAQTALDTEFSAIVRALLTVKPGEEIPKLEVKDGSRGLFESERMFLKPMTVLMTLVGLVLLLACANIANLMLARGAQREREMSVRMALGAGRARILRQMLVESLLLAGIGGVGGIVAGYIGRTVLPGLTANSWERNAFHIRFDWRVFAFTAAITIATGILFGMAPALTAARAEASDGLKDGGRTATRRRKGMGSKALVAFQIALAMLLVVGAGLFLRTLAGLSAVDVGFRTDHLLLVQFSPPQNRYPAGKDIALYQRLEQAFTAVPGVESVTAAESAYVSDDRSGADFLLEGEKPDSKEDRSEDYDSVGNRFFETMGIPIIAGRGFGPQDTATSQKVAVINQALARSRFPGQNPIGRRFSTSAGLGESSEESRQWIQIVGICADTRYENLRDQPPPQFLIPYVQQQSESWGMTYEIRTRVEPESIVPALRAATRQVDPDLPVVNVRTQRQQIEADMQEERLFVTLTSGFGLLALALATVGIYGIMAYSVAQRTNEIGIRMALGAQRASVLGMVLGEAAWIAAIGVIAGTGAALGMGKLVASMLYGLKSWDPATLVGSAALLGLVALAASWIPARRAAGVDPMTALRHE
ncbi:MAG TPA: ABC transporter permease [Terracidiphilus sp.]|nr:ABC transporter permease [Terracidiphilus sp.]